MNFTYNKPMQNERELLEPGWYDFDVIHVYDTAQNGEPLMTKEGVPFLKVVCREIASGATVWHLVFLEEENAKRISALLHACLIPVEDGQQIVITAETFKGHGFRGRVETNPGFDGQQRNRIMRVIQRKEGQAPTEPVEAPTLQPDDQAEHPHGDTDPADDLEDDDVPF